MPAGACPRAGGDGHDIDFIWHNAVHNNVIAVKSDAEIVANDYNGGGL